MPRPTNLEYEQLDEQLQNIDDNTMVKADPSKDLSDVELLQGLLLDESEFVVETIQSSLADSLIEDIAEEILEEIAQQTLDILVDLLDGPAASAQDAVTQTAAEILAQHPEIASKISQPEYAQAICDGIAAAL